MFYLMCVLFMLGLTFSRINHFLNSDFNCLNIVILFVYKNAVQGLLQIRGWGMLFFEQM